MCFHIIKCVHSFYYTHISVCHFVGVFIYAGTINRPLQLLTVCQNAADGLPITLRTPTKLVANIPPGVGADSSRPYPCIIKNVYLRNQIRISVSPHAHIRFPFRGCIRICGRDKSDPYGCWRFAITLRIPTKWGANIPPGVGDRFIAPVS